MLRDVEAWMAEKDYKTIADFRGKVSQLNCYVRLLLSQ